MAMAAHTKKYLKVYLLKIVPLQLLILLGLIVISSVLLMAFGLQDNSFMRLLFLGLLTLYPIWVWFPKMEQWILHRNGLHRRY